MNHEGGGGYFTGEAVDGGAQKPTFFELDREVLKKICEGGFAAVAEEAPNLSDAFDLEKHTTKEGYSRCLCCMDERTPYGLHAAGSAILKYLEAEKKKPGSGEDVVRRFCSRANIDALSSHRGCGAAAIFANSEIGKKFAQDQGIDPVDTNLIAKTWSMKMAEVVDVPHVHLELEEPRHSATVCYYDGTGTFNNIDGLPKGFVVGRGLSAEKDKADCLEEVGIAIGIAQGEHGFGPDFFTKENPFLVVAIGKTEAETEELKKELASMNFGENVAIDGFVAPTVEGKIEKRRALAV